jgi:hypothetical protein
MSIGDGEVDIDPSNCVKLGKLQGTREVAKRQTVNNFTTPARDSERQGWLGRECSNELWAWEIKNV